MQVSAKIAQVHELRQLAVPRGLQLAEIFAELRRNVLVAEELV